MYYARISWLAWVHSLQYSALNYRSLLLGLVLGVLTYALWSWRKKRRTLHSPTDPPILLHQDSSPEKAPSRHFKFKEPDWLAIDEQLMALEDVSRQRELARLRRIFAIASSKKPAGACVEEIRNTIAQEVGRLSAEAEQDLSEEREDDLDKLTEIVKWALQKGPELMELDLSDVLMAKAILDLNRYKTKVHLRFLKLSSLVPIHPIDRESANQKCDERAAVARKAFPLIRKNNMRLSEALISSTPELKAFESVTGIQVVQTDKDTWVTFEGNGRAEALKRAFADKPQLLKKLEVECREFVLAPGSLGYRKVLRRLKRAQRAKGVEVNNL
eukprot:g34425.t1